MYKIYKIVDNTNNNVYIGLTTKTYLSSRIAIHRYGFKKNSSCSSKIILKNNDWYSELIEETDDKEREKYWIQNTPNCINKMKYDFDQKEYNVKNKTKRYENVKNFRLKNKSYCKEYRKEYRLKNKTKMNEDIKEYRKYLNSWGGDPRSNNNILKISMDVFN